MRVSTDFEGPFHLPPCGVEGAQSLPAGADARVGYFADDVVWEAPDTLLTGGVIRGRDAVLDQ